VVARARVRALTLAAVTHLTLVELVVGVGPVVERSRLALVFDSVEPDGEVLGAVADVVELVQHELDLLGQLAGAGRRPELYGLDKRALELLVELVGGLDLEDVVAEGHDVGHRLHLQLLGRLEEGPDLPLLVLARQFLLELGPRRDDLDVALEYLGSERHEPLGAELDPALGRIRNDEHLAVEHGPLEQLCRVLVDVRHLLLDLRRQGLVRLLVDELLVGDEEGSRDECVVPVEDDERLVSTGLLLGRQPHLLVRKLRQQAAPPLLSVVPDRGIPQLLVLPVELHLRRPRGGASKGRAGSTPVALGLPGVEVVAPVEAVVSLDTLPLVSLVANLEDLVDLEQVDLRVYAFHLLEVVELLGLVEHVVALVAHVESVILAGRNAPGLTPLALVEEALLDDHLVLLVAAHRILKDMGWLPVRVLLKRPGEANFLRLNSLITLSLHPRTSEVLLDDGGGSAPAPRALNLPVEVVEAVRHLPPLLEGSKVHRLPRVKDRSIHFERESVNELGHLHLLPLHLI